MRKYFNSHVYVAFLAGGFMGIILERINLSLAGFSQAAAYLLTLVLSVTVLVVILANEAKSRRNSQ